MRLQKHQITVGSDAEKLECAKAAVYGCPANIYTGIQSNEFSPGTSFIVLRGLARLSLAEPETDFQGLTPESASARISELCGDSEDYVPKEWSSKVH